MIYRKHSRLSPLRYWLQLGQRVGRRGFVLILLGTIWVFTGLSALTGPEPQNVPMLAEFDALRSLAWISTGILGIYAAFQARDRLGFIALYIMAAYRFLAYVFSFISWAAGWGGNGRGLAAASMWLVIILLLILIAGWDEPNPREGDE